MSVTIIVLGAGVVAGSALMLALMFIKSNQVNLTEKTEDKPEWMRSTPPVETIAATKSDNEGVTLYDHDEGEQLASPFAEQIEDVLRAKISDIPELASFEIDFGTGSDGSLEIWVDGEKFSSVDALTNDTLKRVFREAVKDWNSRK